MDNLQGIGASMLLTHSLVRVSTAPVCVNYRVATERDMENIVTAGQVYTSSDIDYTVKVREAT